MTPWKKRPSRQPKAPDEARDVSMKAHDAEIDGGLLAEMSDPTWADDLLITDYVTGGLSAEDHKRVEERLRTDPKFRALAEPSIILWTIPISIDPDLIEGALRRLEEHESKKLKAVTELHRQGIPVSPESVSREHRRHNTHGWLDPKDFVRRLAARLGTKYGSLMEAYLFQVVQETGKPDPWIAEVGHARERGDFSPADAEYLIYELAASAVMKVSRKHPVISRLRDQMNRLEREHGLEAEIWDENEGPPEWQALYQQLRTAMADLVIEILLRNGEGEIAERFAAWAKGR
jgi:hypothetical protein